MGYDSDHPRVARRGRPRGRRGRLARGHGDALRRDPARRGLDVDDDQRARRRCCSRSTSASASSRASPRAELRGTIQTDILKEYIAQKEWIFPPEPSHAPRRRHDRVLRRASCRSGTRSRSPATTSARPARPRRRSSPSRSPTGSPTSRRALERGLDVDEFAPRLSFFFNAHIDFFEEIAKYRAARRIWARELRERYGAKDPRSWRLRFHTQTAGVSLTAQQPELNIVRTAIEALAAVLGGTQSLHTNSFDEALALPTEHAAQIALRTQQVIAHETGVAIDDRPARRLLVRRGADEPARGGGVRLLPADRRARRGGRGDRGELLPARDRRGVRSATSRRSRPGSASSSA